MSKRAVVFLGPIFFSLSPAWTQPYTISTVAGTDRVLDGHPATSVPLRQPIAVALDNNGNLYVADEEDNRIRKIDTSGVITTYAGTGLAGYNGDRIKATTAALNSPTSIAFDANGNLYVADSANSRVRIISPDGTINTVAGNGMPGFLGDGGPATGAEVDPIAIALDPHGDLFISTADFRIRKVDTSGTITTICGTGTANYAGDNGPANLAAISQVTAMVTDAKGNLYLADYDNGYVRMIDTTGTIHPVAGSGPEGYPFDNIPASEALMVPNGLALDSTGNNLYISDADLIFTEIRVVDLTTTLIENVAGNGNPGFLGDNGPAAQAEFFQPSGLALASSGSVYVADMFNQRVRKIAGGIVTTVAGTNNGDGSSATSAFLNFPIGVAVDAASNIVVADSGGFDVRRFTLGGSINTFGQLHGSPAGVAVDSSGNFYVTDNEPYVLKITPAGVTSIVAGNGQAGYDGDNGPATSATLGNPNGVAVDTAGNVYFTDTNRIRKVTAATGVITTIAGTGSPIYSGDHGPALQAGMNAFDVAVDSQGNLYIADSLNNRIREVTVDGNVVTVAGTGTAGHSGDGGPAASAELQLPNGVAVDSSNNLYIADFGNSVVRRVNSLGLISTIAGDGVGVPSTGDGGTAIAAQINPVRLTVDSAGDIYVADFANDRVRKLTPVVITAASLTIVSGDKQSGTVGTALTAPLVIKVSDSGGNPVPGVVVNFSVTPANAATVAPSPAITLNDGTVTANVTLGNAAGTITITAAASGLTNVSFSITANPAVSPTAPVISAGGIVSGGLSAPVLTTVSSNGIATIFGDKFAPAGTARQVGGQDLVDGKIQTNLIGVCAVFGTQLAPILGVYPQQLNVQVPQLPPGEVKVQVITNCGTAQSQTSNTETATIKAAAPEFFYFAHNADGHDPIAAINAVTHGSVGASSLGTGFAPAKPGDLLTLFGTGFGATNPAFGPGVLPGQAAQVTGSVSITFGGVKLAPSDILYVGVTQNAGLYQVNLRVPTNVPNGDQSVVITIGGVSSPAGGFITVNNVAAGSAAMTQ